MAEVRVRLHGCTLVHPFYLKLLGVLGLTLHEYLRVDDDRERGAAADFAIHFDVAAHLLDDELANAQAETSARWIDVVVLFHFHEVDEEILLVLFRDADALVLDLDCEFDVADLVFVVLVIKSGAFVLEGLAA